METTTFVLIKNSSDNSPHLMFIKFKIEVANVSILLLLLLQNFDFGPKSM